MTINSSGQIVQEAAKAKDDNANSTVPASPQQVLTPERRIVTATPTVQSNALQTPTTENGGGDAGTNAPLRPITNTQAVDNTRGIPIYSEDGTLSTLQRNPETGELYDPGFMIGTKASAPSGGPGAAAPGDDQRGNESTGVASNTVRNTIDELYAGVANSIAAQPNVLDQYASYTYSLSWYLMNPQAYIGLLKIQRKSLSGYYLLAQSGGAPISQSGAVPSQQGIGPNEEVVADIKSTSGRSPYFQLDYYLDNLEIESKLPGPGTGAATNSQSLSFTVTEPNGITLLKNLYSAVGDLYKTEGQVGASTTPNYAAAQYCMIIRFYGYDAAGNLVQVGKQAGSTTDNRAVVEKFIPFIIEDIQFSVGNKLVEYKVKGKVPDTSIAKSSARGTIPISAELSGRTVKDILVGKPASVSTTANKPAGDKTRNNKPIQPNPPAKKSPADLKAVQNSQGSEDHYDEMGNFVGTW